jgi:hypothetical protein
MSGTALMHGALVLAARMPIFPCINAPGTENDKKPLTAHGFKDASTNADLIRHWWTRWPNALIAVPAGINFVAVDLDLQHVEAQRWLDENRDRFPITRTHATRSGGRHLLFKPDPRVRCATGKIAPHIDTRGRGGYIIWWPAIGLQVQNPAVLAPVPEAIIAALKPPPQKNIPATPGHFKMSDGKLAGILRTIARAPEGQRNSLTFWGACRIAEMVAVGALSDSEALELIIEAASRAGLPAAEAKRTAQSALGKI